jgi:FkbM family methyltransferase
VNGLRQIVRGARATLHRSRVGRWLERRGQIDSARRWTAADEPMRRFYSAFAGSGELVFDVGANVGNRTKIFLRLGCRVLAVEPQAACASVLSEAFAGESRFTLVREALGAAPGTATMRVCDTNTISSMSPGWIEAVRSSGRFASFRWDREVSVPVTTMDALIQRHGSPAFVKIDVEGFELDVLSGLSRPVRALSFEYTPECADVAQACLARLESLGFHRFNYSSGESMRLEYDDWAEAVTLRRKLDALRGDPHEFGDVYARFEAAAPAAGRGGAPGA